MSSQTVEFVDAAVDSGVEIKGLDPTVAKLGLAVGLLQPGSGANTYTLNTAWFANPISATQQALTANGAQLADLIGAVLGSLGGSALGIPLENTGELGTWYPILNPKTGKPTGLYLVARTSGATTVFGLGINYSWPVSESFSIRAWGLAPLVQVGNDSYSLAIGQDGNPITLGIETVSTTPLVDSYGLELAGMRMTASLGLFPSAAASMSIEAVGLQLPGESQPKDRSLSDLEQLTGAQILATISTVFVAAMSDALGDSNNPQLGYVLPVLGLSPVLPQAVKSLFPDVDMPLLRWDQMIRAAVEGTNPAQPFKDWFSALLESPTVMQAWLASIQGLEGLTPGANSGQGTREDPWSIPVLSTSVGTLSFQFATVVDNAGARTFYPGLNFLSAKLQLGTSQAALRIAAHLELAQFTLSQGGVSGNPTDLEFSASMQMVGLGETNGVDDPLFSGTIANNQYIFGALNAGLRLGNASGSLKVIPSFTLTGLTTPSGTFAVLDLTQPSQVVQQTQTEVAGLINSALQAMFGLGPDSEGTPSNALATLLGIVPPGVGTGNTWPAALVPPLSAAALFNSVQDPLQALSTYFYSVVTSTDVVGGQAPFFYMFREMATLLQALAQVTTPVVTGTGKPLDPWKAPLTNPGTLGTSLIAYTVARANGSQRLVMGFDVDLQLSPGGLAVSLGLGLELFSLDLASTSAGCTASPQILPGVGLSLTLPSGFQSPAVAGTSISVSASSIQMGWSPDNGWAWSMEVGQPALHSNGQTFPVGQSMVYTQGQSLEDLVLKQADTFGQILTGILGLAVMEANDRAGLAFAGILGLLPDLGSLMPSGLTWPSDMPTLAVTSFTDPFAILRTQLTGLFSAPANLRAALQLLSWASSDSASVPTIAGSGTVQDPFFVPLGLTCGIGLAVWADSAAGTAGLGLAKSGVLDVSSSVRATSQIVVRLLNVTLATGSPAALAGVPGVSVTCAMTNPSGQLLPPTADGSSLDSITVGAVATVGGTLSAPTAAVTPTFLLYNLKLPGQDAAPVVDLAAPGALNAQLVQDAFNLALQVVLPTAVEIQPFGTAYDLLATMGLALPQGTDQSLGINPAGWRALLADPLTFTSQRLIALAADPKTRDALIGILQQLTGVTLPVIPQSVLELLVAMELITAQDEGYVVIPSAFVQLFSHPVTYLQARFTALLADPVQLAALLAVLQQTTGIETFGPFQLEVLSGPAVEISILPGTVKAGTMLNVSGNLRFGLNAGAESLRLSLELYNPQTGVGLAPMLQGDFSGSFTFSQFVTFGDGATPAPSPLRIWPFDSTTFVNELAAVAPFYALSVLVSQVVDPQLLQKYTLVQALFSILGIAEQDAGGVWHTRSLLGLFDDPVEWLLSNAVLGADGKLNITQLNTLLKQVPNVTGSQPTIQQVPNGITLGSLPYNLEVTLTADPVKNLVTLAPAMTETLPVAGGAASVTKLGFSLTLGPDFQPGFGGTITMGIDSPALSVTAGYDQEFLLSVALAGSNGSEPATLDLVPFMGWQDLLVTAVKAAVQTLLPQLTSSLLEGLEQAGAGTFVTAMRTAGTNLDITALLNALLSAGVDESALETAALAWLGQRLSTANVDQTAAAVIALLSPVLGKDIISSSGGLISYKPSSSLPLVLQIGAQNNLIGIWAAITMPSNLAVQIAVAPTGVAIPYDPSTGAPSGDPQFSFGISVGVPIQGEANMPLLTLGFADGKFTAGLDPMGTPSARSELSIELLPQFFSNPPNLETAVEDWLLLVLQQAVPRYLSLIILNQSTIKSWLDSSLFSTTKPGTVLVAAGLLTETSDVYALETFAALSSLTVETFVAGLLKAMLSIRVQVASFGDSGQIWIGPSSEGSSDFGITVAAQNISLEGAPNFVFQLGGSDVGWITEAGGPKDLEAGVSVFVPIDTAPHFDKLKLQVVNVGVDFVGKNGAPLVEMSRFSVGAVEPRGVLIFDFSLGAAPTVWGGEITVADIGISLSPDAIGSGGNPVAQNLLGSGSSDGDGGTEGNAANPPFSFRAGYLMNGGTGDSVVELLQGDQVAQELWFPVQRGFGPVHVNMLGVKWISPQTAGVGFDGDLSLAGLNVAVQKLTVSFDVFDPTDYSKYQLDLAGLDVSFNNGPVAISGAFFKQTDPVLQYTGAAMLTCASFSLNALGSYAVVPVNASAPGCQKQGGDCPTAASLFIFVNLNAPLGGPPAFFVTGLAAGFGYNRDILIPPVGEISSFPLVAGATNPEYFTSADPAAVLTQISAIVPPEIGAYWVAAGLKFTSFELLSTFALLFVKFGKQVELDLVGVSSASLPPKSPETLAYMELGILISFKPADGYISVQAQLTPNSYLLAPPCKLTGGFAFVVWFSGDFVLTLGGYHPMFQKPDNYPDVPRLGFNWPIDISPGSLKVAGGAYFALTPTAVMAGGYLQVAFTLGPIRAWLNAGADFLIQWKPFYYDISVEVSIGVAFHTKIAGISITLSASLGAALHLWGPETAGYAEVNWYVISFTIPIGDQQKNLHTQPLGTWDEFALAFLPPAKNGDKLQATDQPPGAVLGLTATQGAISGPAGQGSNGAANAWALSMSQWQIQVSTAVPASAVTVNTVSQAGGQPMGVRPMNVPSAATPLSVSLSAWDASGSNWQLINLSSSALAVAALTNNAPLALWGKSAMNLNAPPVQPYLIPNACMGITITGADFTYKDPVGPISLEDAFSFAPAPPRDYPGQPQWPAPPAYSQNSPLARLSATIMAPTVITMRDAVLATLEAAGMNVMKSPQLPVIAADADAIYQAPPYLAPVGVNSSPQPSAIECGGAPATLRLDQPAPQPAEYLELLGGIHRYRYQENAGPRSAIPGREHPQLRLPIPRRTGRWVGQTRLGAPSRGLGLLRTQPAALRRGDSRFQENLQVAPGTSLLLETKMSEGSQAYVQVDGKVSVRLWKLNEFDEIIGNELIGPGSSATLDSGVARVALSGEGKQASGQPEGAIGWQRNSALTQIGRYSFLGDRCLVRPQATPIRKQGRRHISSGAVDGDRIVRGNLVEVNGANVPGWLETMLDGSFLGQSRSVAVALRGITPEAAAHVAISLAWTEHPWQPVYETTVRPDHVLGVEDGCILFFPAPPTDTDAAAARWLAVLVDGSADYELEGVWGVPRSVDELSRIWPGLTGLSDGIAPNPEEQAWSTVSVRITRELGAAERSKGVSQ